MSKTAIDSYFFLACAAFHFSRASRCSLAESFLRCMSQMNPKRGSREMFLQPATRQLMSSLRPLAALVRRFDLTTSEDPPFCARSARMRFCSRTGTDFECSLQNQRLRGPLPGFLQPGYGHMRVRPRAPARAVLAAPPRDERDSNTPALAATTPAI